MNPLRWFSPFRIRFLLVLLLMACATLWIKDYAWERRSAIAWDRIYEPDYLRGEMSIPEFESRIAAIHKTTLRLPGFVYTEDRAEPFAPAPFASKVLDREVVISYWLLTLLSATPLLAYFILTRKRRRAAARIRRGLCPVCNYDLRAHQPGEKCPECGTQISTKLG